jgi:Flp pilus assembly protein TadG
MFLPFRASRRAFERFGKARQGVAAVEFALIVVPFFFLTFGLAEVAMLGFAQTSLNFAVADAGRQIRTGQAQLNGVTYSEIQDMVCQRLNRFLVLSCEDTLYLDVDRYDSYAQAGAQPNPIQAGNFDDSNVGYSPGAPSDIVVVRAYFRWKIITPMFEGILGNVSGGERILVSTMMFRNEPYQ